MKKSCIVHDVMGLPLSAKVFVAGRSNIAAKTVGDGFSSIVEQYPARYHLLII